MEPQVYNLNAADLRPDDPEWMLGIARLRAQQIVKLIQLYRGGEVGFDGALDAIGDEAQAILDGR